MAKYRCLSDEVLFNDNFLSLPSKSRDLYTYINHETDDYGFCCKVKSITKMLSTKPKDLQLLIDSHFLIKFEDWLYLEKHFFINNKNIRLDRLKPTNYAEYLSKEVFEKLGKTAPNIGDDQPRLIATLKDNNAYTLIDTKPLPNDAKPQPNDTKTAPNTIQYNTIQSNIIQSNTIQSNDNDGEIKSIDELKRRLRGV